jgi:hypothetical protein
VTPDALFPVHLAEGVVQENVGRAGRERARVVADHGVEAEQRLHELALEPAVEVIRRRRGEEVEQRPARAHRELAQGVTHAGELGELGDGARTEPSTTLGGARSTRARRTSATPSISRPKAS